MFVRTAPAASIQNWNHLECNIPCRRLCNLVLIYVLITIRICKYYLALLISYLNRVTEYLQITAITDGVFRPHISYIISFTNISYSWLLCHRVQGLCSITTASPCDPMFSCIMYVYLRFLCDFGPVGPCNRIFSCFKFACDFGLGMCSISTAIQLRHSHIFCLKCTLSTIRKLMSALIECCSLYIMMFVLATSLGGDNGDVCSITTAVSYLCHYPYKHAIVEQDLYYLIQVLKSITIYRVEIPTHTKRWGVNCRFALATLSPKYLRYVSDLGNSATGT